VSRLKHQNPGNWVWRMRARPGIVTHLARLVDKEDIVKRALQEAVKAGGTPQERET